MMARTFVTLASLELASALQAHVAPRTPAPHMMAKSKVAPMFDAPAQLKGYVGEEDGFDPLGFSTLYDMKWLREAEIKHGRICMLAFVGFIFPDAIMRLPGHTESSFAAHDLNLGFAGGAMGQVARPPARVRALPCHSAAARCPAIQLPLISIAPLPTLPQIIMFISVLEILMGIPAINLTMNGGDREPGDYSFDPLGFLADATPEVSAARAIGSTESAVHPAAPLSRYLFGVHQAAEDMKLKELKNGRLAMLAFSGVVTQSAMGHTTFQYNN